MGFWRNFYGVEESSCWIFSIEKYFRVNNIVEDVEKMKVVAMAMRGCALKWWLWRIRPHPSMSWNTFTEIFFWHFKPKWRHFFMELDEEIEEKEKPDLLIEQTSTVEVNHNHFIEDGEEEEDVEPDLESMKSKDETAFLEDFTVKQVPAIDGDLRVLKLYPTVKHKEIHFSFSKASPPCSEIISSVSVIIPMAKQFSNYLDFHDVVDFMIPPKPPDTDSTIKFPHSLSSSVMLKEAKSPLAPLISTKPTTSMVEFHFKNWGFIRDFDLENPPKSLDCESKKSISSSLLKIGTAPSIYGIQRGSFIFMNKDKKFSNHALNRPLQPPSKPPDQSVATDEEEEEPTQESTESIDPISETGPFSEPVEEDVEEASYLYTKQVSQTNLTTTMEEDTINLQNKDPYAIISKTSRVSTSQEHLLQHTPFIGDTRTSQDMPSQFQPEISISSAPILILSPPDNQDGPQNVFHTPPEEYSLPSSDVDVPHCPVNQVVDVDSVSQLFVDLDFGKDSELGFLDGRLKNEVDVDFVPEDEFRVSERVISDLGESPVKKLKLGFDSMENSLGGQQSQSDVDGVKNSEDEKVESPCNVLVGEQVIDVNNDDNDDFCREIPMDDNSVPEENVEAQVVQNVGDAFYTIATSENVKEGLHSFEDGGIPAKFVIILLLMQDYNLTFLLTGLTSATNFVKEIYNLGARRIAVLDAPLIEYVSSQRTLGGRIVRECAEKYNDAAKLYFTLMFTPLYLISFSTIKYMGSKLLWHRETRSCSVMQAFRYYLLKMLLNMCFVIATILLKEHLETK